MIIFNNWSDILDYDESLTSCLRWKIDVPSGKGGTLKMKGLQAGSPNKSRRWSVSINKKLVQCHTIIWEMFYGKYNTSLDIDHIDGDCENNKINNLRVVTHKTNMQNCKLRKDNKTGIKGVFIRRRGNYTTVCATWSEQGKKKSKEFSVNKYTLDVAINMAENFRKEKLFYLNSNGENYSQRHLGEIDV